jgi:hypothetical protein
MVGLCVRTIIVMVLLLLALCYLSGFLEDSEYGKPSFYGDQLKNESTNSV